MVREFRGLRPRIHPDAVILEPAVVCGDVEIGPDSSVWFHAVVRGDVGPVRIGARSNLQDGVIVHETTGGVPCVIEDDVTVGHGAVIHGARLKRGCLVGMRAVVLDGAVVGERCMVGAGALVPEGMVIPDGHLAVGVPARVKRPLTAEELASLEFAAAHYVEYSREYRDRG